jgi:hypothetical protein
MADADVTVTVKTVDQGSAKMKQFADGVKNVNGSVAGAQAAWGKFAVGVGAAAGVMVAGAVAAKKLYATLREGATLQTTTQRFDKLSQSIGTTADVMLGQLRNATQGMISDMDLMASASQIISLKLADNSEQVTRLATVVGTLGWDMNQVILTFANLSTMRLDALGLSVEEVKTKAAELEKSGMSAQAAFKEAVILAGEARLDVGGVGATEKAFKQLEAAIANSRSELSLAAVEIAKNIGLIDAMSESASKMQVARQYRELIAVAKEAGAISPFEATMRTADIAGQSVQQVEESLRLLEIEVRNSDAAWFYLGDVAAAINADIRNEVIETIGVVAIATNNLIAMSADAEKLASANFMGAGRARNQLEGDFMSGRNGLPWMQAERIQIGALERATMSYDEAAAAVGGYSSALSEVEKLEMELTEGRARMVAAFSAEINYTAPVDDPTTKKDEGGADTSFILENGLVNVEAMNKALFEQSEAAGASAMSLALLGVATGQFTEEQATAALKAAVLQERIMQLAKGITSGDLSIGDALSNLALFQQNIDAAAPGSGIQATIESLVSTIPAEDRTIDFLSDTGMVDDDIRRLESKHIVIPATIRVTNPNPVDIDEDPDRSRSTNKGGPTSITVDMKLDFHGTANQQDVAKGVRDGMGAWSRDLRREGVF